VHGHHIIVIGASAGGIEALTRVVRELPAGLGAAVFVVVHFPSHGTSVLPRILSGAGPLPAAHARDGEAIEPGRIYVAPPDCHLLVKRDRVRVIRGPRENGHRPAVDPLFRTAAAAYGGRVVGVVLSGMLDDGTTGLIAIKRRGGRALVQDPEDALYASMPRSALEHVEADGVAPATEIAGVLARWAAEPIEEEEGEMDDRPDFTELYMQGFETSNAMGHPSGFTCPECSGALWDIRDGELTRFRCRVGHSFSSDALLSEQSDSLESALWTAVTALEERAALLRRVAARMDGRARNGSHERLGEEAEAADRRAALIRGILQNGAAEPDTQQDEQRSFG
jgi:two-component system chemotaxis response regulator CheB